VQIDEVLKEVYADKHYFRKKDAMQAFLKSENMSEILKVFLQC